MITAPVSQHINRRVGDIQVYPRSGNKLHQTKQSLCMGLIKRIIWRLIEGEKAEKIVYKASSAFRKGGIYRQLARYRQVQLRKRFACYISAKASFGEGLKLPHPTGIVIGDGVQIGRSVTIYQNVTIGAARRGEGAANLYPRIGDGVTIYAGAKILGAIEIGADAKIAANCVVLKDVLPGQVIAGVPGKVVASRDQT